MLKKDQGTKRPLEESGSNQGISIRYPGSQNIRDLAKADLEAMEMAQSSASSSAAASRRSSVSSISSVMNKDLAAINAFRGNAFGSANVFKPAGGLPPVHSSSQDSSVLQRQETGGAKAQLKSILAEYTVEFDAKIKAAIQPISEAQAAAEARVDSISSSVKQASASVQTQLSENEKHILQSFEKSTAQMRKRIEESATNQSQRMANIADSVHKAQESIAELFQDKTELRQEMSENHSRALAAAQKTEESLGSQMNRLEEKLRQEISSGDEQTIRAAQAEIAKASSALEAKAATNLAIAIDTLDAKTENQIAALERETKDNINGIQIDIGALIEKFNATVQKEIRAFREEITALENRVDSSELDHISTRDSFVKALIGLKGHLLANTTEFITYREDYSEHDKKRLELWLEIMMYDEVGDFVKEFAPNLTEVLAELKSVAEQNFKMISNYSSNVDQAAALYDVQRSASVSATSEEDEADSHIEGDLHLTDLTTPVTGDSGFGRDDS